MTLIKNYDVLVFDHKLSSVSYHVINKHACGIEKN